MAVFKRRRFPAEIILLCVRWYCRYGISYRDLEEMMVERGVAVDHTTLYRWTQRYAPELEKRVSERPPGLSDLLNRLINVRFLDIGGSKRGASL